jgi:hypothetical protein
MKVVFLFAAGLAVLWAFSRARPVLSYEGPQLYDFGWDDSDNEGMPTNMVLVR